MKVKAEAAKLNGGKEVKLKLDSGLGPALDAYQKAEDRADTVDGSAKVSDKEWIKAKQEWIKALVKLSDIMRNYLAELRQLGSRGLIPAPVHQKLNDALEDLYVDLALDRAKKSVPNVQKEIERRLAHS